MSRRAAERLALRRGSRGGDVRACSSRSTICRRRDRSDPLAGGVPTVRTSGGKIEALRAGFRGGPVAIFVDADVVVEAQETIAGLVRAMRGRPGRSSSPYRLRCSAPLPPPQTRLARTLHNTTDSGASPRSGRGSADGASQSVAFRYRRARSSRPRAACLPRRIASTTSRRDSAWTMSTCPASSRLATDLELSPRQRKAASTFGLQRLCAGCTATTVECAANSSE